MSLKSKPVSMPEKKITFKRMKNGEEYAYYTLRSYRKNGKPTNDQVAIGKKDKTTGMLIPNMRYYDIFQSPKPILKNKAEGSKIIPNKVSSCGNTVVLTKITERIGLMNILKESFPNKWNEILASAFYILCESNIMMYIEDWFDDTKVSFTDKMNDIDCSRLFASITETERRDFFGKWVKCCSEKEYIAYDVSSISTSSENIDMAEWGYNRDNENLPQVNLGMYYGMTSHLPVCYDVYSGSIPDGAFFEFMMSNVKDFGIDGNICFVFDRAFVSEDNILSMKDSKYSFVTALPGHRLDALKLIEENKSCIRKVENWIKEYKLYGIKREIEVYGMDLEAHIYYSPDKYLLDEKELYSRLEKLESELEKMLKLKCVPKKYSDYFVIDKKNIENVFEFELNKEKVNKKLEELGFFILLSSNH